jgi:nucleoid-associated protein EbfC
MGMEDDAEREVQKLMTQLDRQRKQIETTQQEILATEITGSAERGMVTVTMNGGGRFTGVTVERDAVRKFEPHLLGPVVLDAIHDAMRQLAELTRERFSPLVPDPSVLDDAVTYWKPGDGAASRAVGGVGRPTGR